MKAERALRIEVDREPDVVTGRLALREFSLVRRDLFGLVPRNRYVPRYFFSLNRPLVIFRRAYEN